VSRREVAKQKTVAHNHVLVLQAMARQANPDTIANQWLDHNANKAPSADDRQAAQAWTAANITLNSAPLGNALDQMYGAGWAFGSADGQEKLGGQFDENFWDHWQPGNEAAAALVDPPKGLQALLEQAQVTMKEIDAYTLDRIGSQLASGLAQGFGADKMSQAVYQVLRDPARSMVIARTETARALIQANVAEYLDAGVEKVQWLVADPDDDCLENANVIVNYGDEFPSGDIEPPVHPNCMCDLGPVSQYSPALDLGVTADVVKDWDEDAHEREDNGRFGTGSSASFKVPTPAKIDAYLNQPQSSGRTPQAIAERMEQKQEAMLQKTTEEQRDAVISYMNDSYALNNALREGNDLTPEQTALVEQLDSVMAMSEFTNSVYDTNTPLYRVCDSSVFDGVQKGEILQDHAYVSTTTDLAFAQEMAGYSGYDATMVIYSTSAGSTAFRSETTGISVDSLAGDKSFDQKEILLPRDSSFVYAGKDSDGNHVLIRTK